jgi:hypothetical protein
MKYLVLNQSAKLDNSASSTDIAQQLKSRILNLKTNFYDLERGGVNYEGMKDSGAFEDYTDATKCLTSFDLKTLATREAKLAFWINIYNALVVHGIVQLNIVKSVKEVSSFFETVSYDVGGYVFSLDNIEHGILRGNKKKHLLSRRPFADSDSRNEFVVEKVDPRIHFALVCGSRSCPPIEVYEEGEIDEQLELVSMAFINSDEVTIDRDSRKLKVSKIFDWYKDDFGGKEGIMAFILKYRYDPEEQEFLEHKARKLHVTYNEYDWSLNFL